MFLSIERAVLISEETAKQQCTEIKPNAIMNPGISRGAWSFSVSKTYRRKLACTSVSR